MFISFIPCQGINQERRAKPLYIVQAGQAELSPPMPKTIEMEPSYSQRVTPRRYLELYSEDPQDIESVRVVAPRIGSPGSYGLIEIKRKTPIFQLIGSGRKIDRPKRHLSKGSARLGGIGQLTKKLK